MAAAKSDILFRPRAKVMRERARRKEGERRGARWSRGKIGVFCRDDLCVSFCERRGRRNGERRGRWRGSKSKEARI